MVIASGLAGDLTFMTTGGREIVRYTNTGELLDMISPPAYTRQLPNSRDIAEFSSRMLFGRRPTPEEVRTYSQEPKRYAIRGRSAMYDSMGRLWVLTLRDHDERSWFDVYNGTTLVQSVEARDRVLGFDIMDSILVTLVDRSRLDSDGIPVRAIDWYRIRNDSQLLRAGMSAGLLAVAGIAIPITMRATEAWTLEH